MKPMRTIRKVWYSITVHTSLLKKGEIFRDIFPILLGDKRKGDGGPSRPDVGLWHGGDRCRRIRWQVTNSPTGDEFADRWRIRRQVTNLPTGDEFADRWRKKKVADRWRIRWQVTNSLTSDEFTDKWRNRRQVTNKFADRWRINSPTGDEFADRWRIRRQVTNKFADRWRIFRRVLTWPLSDYCFSWPDFGLHKECGTETKASYTGSGILPQDGSVCRLCPQLNFYQCCGLWMIYSGSGSCFIAFKAIPNPALDPDPDPGRFS